VDKQINFDWNSASPSPLLNAKAFSVRWTGALQAPAPGDYQITANLAHCYPCRRSFDFGYAFAQDDTFYKLSDDCHERVDEPQIPFDFAQGRLFDSG